MSANPLNEHIKKTLEERKIAPSKEAWEQLQTKLDATGVSKKKNVALVYWVAAIFITVLFSSVYLFKPTNQDIPVEVVNKTIELPTTNGVENSNEQIVVTSTKKAKENVIPKVVSANEEVDNSHQEIVANTKEAQNFETEKINDLAMKIIDIKEGGNVTDEEINALLLEAQKSIYADKKYIKQPDSLSAMALLNEVETELDQSFKEKVFEAIKERLNKVKTAVANRNQ